ncbi:MAG: hypothetical protein U0Y82_04075 [Thermoleophilia bacterium]
MFRLGAAEAPDDITSFGQAAGRSGALLLFNRSGTDAFAIARGSWAVTAP